MSKIQITMSEEQAFNLYKFGSDNGFWQSPITDICELLHVIFGLEGGEKSDVGECPETNIKIERIEE